MSTCLTIVSREPEGPHVRQHLSSGVLLLPPPTYTGEVVATVEPALLSHPPLLPNRPYRLWPLPPDPGVTQSPRLVVSDDSILVEPHAEVPS